LVNFCSLLFNIFLVHQDLLGWLPANHSDTLIGV
jgi:hypothetical protein